MPLTFVLTCELDNDAFHPDNGTELARILRNAAFLVEHESLTEFSIGRLRDVNGNCCCTYKVSDEPDQ